MAKYNHIPIFKECYDLTLWTEKTVHNFSRYNKYTLGSEIRKGTYTALKLIITINSSARKFDLISKLIVTLEALKILGRLCNDINAFPAGTKSYIFFVGAIENILRQAEGWKKSAE